MKTSKVTKLSELVIGKEYLVSGADSSYIDKRAVLVNIHQIGVKEYVLKLASKEPYLYYYNLDDLLSDTSLEVDEAEKLMEEYKTFRTIDFIEGEGSPILKIEECQKEYFNNLLKKV